MRYKQQRYITDTVDGDKSVPGNKILKRSNRKLAQLFPSASSRVASNFIRIALRAVAPHTQLKMPKLLDTVFHFLLFGCSFLEGAQCTLRSYYSRIDGRLCHLGDLIEKQSQLKVLKHVSNCRRVRDIDKTRVLHSNGM
jgi:hypothetical protein